MREIMLYQLPGPAVAPVDPEAIDNDCDVRQIHSDPDAALAKPGKMIQQQDGRYANEPEPANGHEHGMVGMP